MISPDELRAALGMLSDRGLHTMSGEDVERVGKRVGAALSGLTPQQAIACLAGMLDGMLGRYAPTRAHPRVRQE